MTNMLGKWTQFAKPNPRPDPDAHFAVIHYAATVSYNLTGWLEKNKDPLNDTIVELIKNGGNSLMVQCFADHPGQPLEAPKDDGGRKKKGGGKTVSSFFKGQLDDLMTTLYKTHPHFIRCVVPNTHKIPGGVEPGLIMHQYQCNGVLAGIAICRKGFPNKMLYPEFKARYNILAAKLVAKAKNDKAAAGAVLDCIKLDKEKFRLGHTKVFFRAGILGFMEEVREDRIGSVLAWLQAGARGKASRMNFKKLQDQKLALYCCQRALRNRKIATTWKWMEIWLAIKPNLKCTQFSKYKADFEKKIALAEANIDTALEDRAKVQKIHDTLMASKVEVQTALDGGGSAIQDIMDKTKRIENMAGDVDKQVSDVDKRVKGEIQQKQSLEQQMNKVTAQVSQIQGEVASLESALVSSEQERAVKDDQIQTLKEEIAHQSDMISKLSKEKRSVGDTKQKSEEDIQAMDDRCNHLSKVKGKLEQSLDECEDALEREKKSKGDVEKVKRKIEGDLKLTQEAVSDLERVKTELSHTLSRKEKELASMGAKIENELTKLKGELEESNISHEGTLAALRSKHNNTMGDLGEQIDSINKNKAKSEKDKAGMERDLQEARVGLEEAMRDRANMEKNCKMTQGLIAESNTKLDELARALNEADSTKKKLQIESQDLTRQIEETEAAIGNLGKNKISLQTQLEDTKKLADGEARDRASLLTKYKALLTDCENFKMKIEEEAEKKNDMLRLLSKAQAEIQLWKSKFETEAMGRIDELEGSRSKLSARVAESG